MQLTRVPAEPPSPAERRGLSFGEQVLSPITSTLSRARHARMFHPEGVVYTARVTAAAAEPALEGLAARLAGPAWLRFSTALWRGGREWPDVLGAALRFLRSAEPKPEGAAVDQDLLLATVRSPWTLPWAPLATNVHSFLWNHYHAVSPFSVDGLGMVKFRLRSPRLSSSSAPSRSAHLREAAANGQARFTLELRRLATPLWSREWLPLASITLERQLEIDQAALRFSPFRCGLGIIPRGFVHALRLAAYAASQSARPTRED